MTAEQWELSLEGEGVKISTNTSQNSLALVIQSDEMCIPQPRTFSRTSVHKGPRRAEASVCMWVVGQMSMKHCVPGWQWQAKKEDGEAAWWRQTYRICELRHPTERPNNECSSSLCFQNATRLITPHGKGAEIKVLLPYRERWAHSEADTLVVTGAWYTSVKRWA